MTVKELSEKMEALIENGQADIEVMVYDMHEGWKPYVYEDTSFHSGRIYLGLPEVTSE